MRDKKNKCTNFILNIKIITPVFFILVICTIICLYMFPKDTTLTLSGFIFVIVNTLLIAALPVYKWIQIPAAELIRRRE